MPPVDAYILSYGNPSNALRCQRSFAGAASIGLTTIIHNPTAIHPMFDEEGEAVGEVIETGHNLGYSGGMNTALRHALRGSASFFLLLTHDVQISPASVAALVRFLEERPEVGMAGPILEESDGTLYSRGGVYRDGIAAHIRSEVPGDPDWIDGAALLIRRACIEDIGLFDDRLFMYWEDVDLSLRARRAGWSIGCCDSSFAFQDHASPESRGKAYDYLMRRNQLMIARKHAGFRLVTQLALRNIGRIVLRRATFSNATLLGDWHAFRTRVGPPPTRLQHGSDIEADRERHREMTFRRP